MCSIITRRGVEMDICTLCGGPKIDAYFKRCEHCRKKQASSMREWMQERQGRGICRMCNKPVEIPSKTYCTEHRLKRNASSHMARKNANEIQRQRMRLGRREAHYRRMYGDEAVLVYRSANDMCMVCGINFEKAQPHIHHIDGNHDNRAQSNLICVCRECHELIHALLSHLAPTAVIKWACAVYPEIKRLCED